MFTKTYGAICAAFLALSAGPLVAADLALVLINSDYDRAGDLRGDGYAARYERELEAAGFTVFALQDGNGEALQDMARDFAAATGAAEQNRVVIVLAGHMAHTGSETYLLGTDSDKPDAFSVNRVGQSVAPLVGLAAEAQGQAVLMIANADGNMIETGTALSAGPGEITAPQGVTLVRGDVQPLLFSLRDGLLPTDSTYALAVERAPRGVEFSGFLSQALGLMTGAGEDGDGVRPELGDFAYWNAVRDIDTEEAYEAYLERYPNGTFAADAAAQLEGLKNAPLREAQEGEADLALTREARREVQRYLSILGHDPRGIDGLFGPATRAALTDWQGANGFDPDGYLDQQQYLALQLKGERRALELEREAEERRARQEQEDRDYWARKNGGEAGLRAYLEQYPDGLFADTARARLRRIEREERQQANEGARAMWDQARDADTPEAYASFLREYPDSPFSDAARARRAELIAQDQDRSNQIAAQQEEAGVAGNPVTRLLVERRLQLLGMQPGAVDGNFDGQTRRAIRRFQRSRGIAVSGYVTQATMVRLLAG